MLRLQFLPKLSGLKIVQTAYLVCANPMQSSPASRVYLQRSIAWATSHVWNGICHPSSLIKQLMKKLPRPRYIRVYNYTYIYYNELFLLEIHYRTELRPRWHVQLTTCYTRGCLTLNINLSILMILSRLIGWPIAIQCASKERSSIHLSSGWLFRYQGFLVKFYNYFSL